MDKLQARTLREAHDGYVKRMSRCSKAFLAIEYKHDLADRGQSVLYGGPSSKDELISALVELHYPRAKMNEAVHVIWHGYQDDYGVIVSNDACEWCNPDPCPVCGAISTCDYDYDGPQRAIVNGRHVLFDDSARDDAALDLASQDERPDRWDESGPALSVRLTDA